ncbi:tetratricopeptide repeat protein [Planctobacterium marinum]|uniref:Sel1 repeat family protein n=1 Tax=Planctobacterium marinum TaxID=1631968 RepID=A0AA48KSR6_9ALTE|nr:hypothetical protein MACH26_22750 [Planctobacterium marinum]
MAEAKTIEDIEFEVTSVDSEEAPEFCIEGIEEQTSSEPEFSLSEVTEEDNSAEEELELVDAPAEMETAQPKNTVASSYSDDILNQPSKTSTTEGNDTNSADDIDLSDNEAIDVELDSALALSHSAGTLHMQQAHQLEMSLLERIDDLIQTLQKRGRSGNSPEQLPHKQFATGLHYIKHESNHYLGAKWLRKSAMQGHAKAQLYLGMLFLQGNGVPKSLFHAYAWFSLAVCQNIPEAKDARKKLERHLTAKEINASLKYAADLLDKIHQP